MELWSMAGGRAALSLRSGRPMWLGWWAAASVGLHGLLLTGSLLLDFRGPVVRDSSLRVRLLTEVPEVVVPPVPARPVARRMTSNPPNSLRREAHRPAVPSGPLRPRETAPSASGTQHGPGISPQGLPSTAQTSPAPTVRPGGGEEQGMSVGPSGEGAAQAAGEGPQPVGDVPPNESTPALPRVEAKAPGIHLVPDSDGNGSGRGGFGASDRRIGSGGGRGPATPGAQGAGMGGAGAGENGVGGPAVASRGGSDQGGGAGLAEALRSIRRRIEEARVYPETARRAGMEGTVEVRFQIGPGGTPVNLEIVKSSGYSELDRASLETIRQAGPYPTVSGRIRIPLAYRLDRW